jgi:hypothetical protein
MKCIFCTKEDHVWRECPMFGSTENYLQVYAPPAPVVPPEGPVNKPRSSLAPKLFEDIYGRDGDAVLSQALDNEDLPPEQRILAMELLTGLKKYDKLDRQDRDLLNDLGTHMAYSPKTQPKQPPAVLIPKKSEATDPYIEEDAKPHWQLEDLTEYSPN